MNGATVYIVPVDDDVFVVADSTIPLYGLQRKRLWDFMVKITDGIGNDLCLRRCEPFEFFDSPKWAFIEGYRAARRLNFKVIEIREWEDEFEDRSDWGP